MSGPVAYVPDVTEGITRIEDLPKPRIAHRSRNYSCRCCPLCGGRAGRWRVVSRTAHDLGDPHSGRPIDLHVRYSTHRCPACRRFFPADQSDLAPPTGNPVSVHHSREIRCREIRCQFIILARKDELTSRQESSGKMYR